MHISAPISEYVPAGQPIQVEALEPMLLDAVPATHWIQVTAPG